MLQIELSPRGMVTRRAQVSSPALVKERPSQPAIKRLGATLPSSNTSPTPKKRPSLA